MLAFGADRLNCGSQAFRILKLHAGLSRTGATRAKDVISYKDQVFNGFRYGYTGRCIEQGRRQRQSDFADGLCIAVFGYDLVLGVGIADNEGRHIHKRRIGDIT